jgi:hypothetical protein
MKDVDWNSIEVAYRANTASNRALAKMYGISEGSIRKKATQLNWTRDAAAVKRGRVNAHFSGSEVVPQSSSRADRGQNARSPQKNTQSLPAGGSVSGQGSGEIAQVGEVRDRSDRVPRSRTDLKARLAQAIDEAVSQDIADMETGLYNARKALQVIGEYLETQFDPNMDTGRLPDPRALQSLLTANGAAIDQIRRIRGLDVPQIDEMEAVKLLFNAGWLPDEMVAAIYGAVSPVKGNVQAIFANHLLKPLELEES